MTYSAATSGAFANDCAILDAPGTPLPCRNEPAISRRGVHPFTGAQLTPRDKGGERRVCYFGQISPPKDVSLFYLVGGDQRIAQWWKEAVTETLHEIEAVTATRVRRSASRILRRMTSPP